MTEENEEGVQGMAPRIEEEGQDGFSVPPTGMSAQVLEGGVPLDEGSAEVITTIQSSREDTPSLDGELVTEADPQNSDQAPVETPKVPMGKVTFTRIVEYRSRTGNYSVPAIVTCTVDSIYQPGVEAGFVPPLSSPAHVHLTVFSPGRTGMRIDQEKTPGAEAFVVQPTHGFPISENVAGCYQEWDIPYDDQASPGTWRWPTRV